MPDSVRSQLLERRVELSMDPPLTVCSSYGSNASSTVPVECFLFFPFRLKVKTNPTCDKITTMTEDEMNDLSSATGRSSGGGIVCELITGVRKLFKFSTFLEDPLGMMFWSEGSISKAMQMRYMDEYYGDKAESIHLSGLYESRLKDFTNAANTPLYREAPIASQCISNVLL